jgi:hypothetical protein
MADYSVRVVNAQADAFESTIGNAPTLEIRTGAKPANCAAADAGTLLVSGALASDWLGNPTSGLKSLLGTFSYAAVASGTAGHFRIKGTGGVCDAQGSITATGGGGDMEMDSTSISSGQTVQLTLLTYTAQLTVA